MENPVLALRTHLGISQKGMADDLGFAPSRICQIETGVAPAGSRFVSKLWKTYPKQLKRLKISPLDVVNWERPGT